MSLTFVDSGVLIALFRGEPWMMDAAIRIIDDPSRVFASSDFVRLEVMPKPSHGKRSREVELFKGFFASVEVWAHPSAELLDHAYAVACKYGLNAMDALHLAAADRLEVDEFVTTEKRSKPIFRVEHVNVVSLHR